MATIKIGDYNVPSTLKTNDEEWVCDICMGVESIVGTLKSGRRSDGFDWQVCKSCMHDAIVDKIKEKI